MYRFISDFTQPYNLLFLLAIAGFLNLWRKRVEKRRRLLAVGVPLGLLFAVSTPAASYLLMGSLEWGYPPRKDRPTEAEAIVVLAGGVLAADEVRLRPELAPDTTDRCLSAALAYRSGGPCPIVVSGGRVEPDSEDPSPAPLMRELLVNSGVSGSDIVIEDRSRSTFENAVESRNLLRAKNIRRIILVTEATHMHRSRLCFEKQGFEVFPWACRHRSTKFHWSPFDFLPNPYAASSTMSVYHEWVGVVWYRLHGRV